MFKKNNEPEIISITDGVNTYDCLVKRTNRRTVSISIQSNGDIIIHSPKFSFKRTLKKFAESNLVWINNKVDLQKIRYEKNSTSYVENETAKYLGLDYTIKLNEKQTKEVEIIGNEIHIKGTGELDIKLGLKSFYRKQAKKIFAERMEYWIPFVDGASIKTRLVIKQMATRWGSMSSAGNMNLNIALIKTPMECIDYVIVHELCHQKHPHHQKSFWDAVSVVMPEYKKQEKILKSYSTDF
ncbi:MAG: M48 family metallopeptidase [Alphaproteobacteria bacterium]